MGKLVCTVEMSKTNGITVTVDNTDDEITQTITMNGSTMIIEVAERAGEKNKSVITQTAGAIAIKCKDFSIEAANTITCSSTKATTLTSGDAFKIESAKDMMLTSSAKLALSASSDLTLKGSDVKVEAQRAASVTAATAEVSGSKSVTLKGAQAQLSGGQVSINADGKLDAKSSGVATLGGSMTTIKGALINAG